jgi:hypothetical protein
MNPFLPKPTGLIKAFCLLLYTLLLVLGTASFASYNFEKATEKKYNTTKSVLESELKRTKDKAKAETVSRQAVELERDALLWMITDSASKIAHLQEVVKKAGSKVKSATVASTLTNVNISAPSKTELITTADSTQCPEPVYSAEINSLWYSGHVFADKDSIRIENLLVRNEFEVWQRDERAGLFKPLQPVVYFKSLNPHTTVTEIQSYAVKPKSQPKVVRVLKGVVIGLAVYGTANLASNFFF